MSETVYPEIGERILFASKIMVNILAEALIGAGAQGLSAPQFRVLDMVQHGVDKPAELARMLDVSPSAISSILTKLEDGGFIGRGHDTVDRRRVILELTPMGTGVVRNVNHARKRLIEAVLEEMDERDVERLEVSLEAFAGSYLRLRGKEHCRESA